MNVLNMVHVHQKSCLKNIKLQNKTKLFRGDTADGFLHCILSDIAVDTQESEIFYQNFTDISSAITTQRLSISGVDEDEEALDLVKFQNAYNMASRMIQCMSEMYDKLINETGVQYLGGNVDACYQ